MDFYAILDQVVVLLQQRQRVTYRALKRQCALDDDALADLTAELLYAHPQVRDDVGQGLLWTGEPAPAPATAPSVVVPAPQAPLAYTPPLSCGEDSHVPQCPGRRTEAGHCV